MNKNKPYIIAETAYNHEGDFRYLRDMTDKIANLKVQAIKYHLMLKLESYMQEKHPAMKLLKTWLFSKKQWRELIDRAKGKKLDVIALCDDVESIKFIQRVYPDIKAIELHAVSLNDYFMLKESAAFKGTIILGVGGSTLDEIEYAVNFLREKGKRDILLMYGFQNYPTNYSEINLSKILKLKKLFDLPVGYADHTAFNDRYNEEVSCMAGMMGINILEKHFTLAEGKKRIDFEAAVGEDKMLKIKNLLSTVLSVYGSGSMKMSAAELKYGQTGPMKKAIVAERDIRKGEKLSLSNLCFKRTREISPVQQKEFVSLIGLHAGQNIKKDEIITFDKLKYKFGKTK
ncbi:MAG: N-acetylneuraminate synthase [Candidatus Omnitrophica bacterium]|nr:N-acetylneuraminate synthase [Candidatus Omnitrophota bacterium]MBU3929180.1 N-acetylneuraminate synthase family protein [bacterium]